MGPIKAMFNHYKPEMVIGKRGAVKWQIKTTQVEDFLHPVHISFNGTKRTLYVREIDINGTSDSMTLYNIDGTIAYGKWRHGYQGGKVHEEGMTFSKKGQNVITTESYASGQIKDQNKYLLSI